MAEDFYEVLGLDKHADPERIRQAYRSEVKKCHPDASGTGASAARFRDVEEAYETLRDPGRRKAYDRALSPGSSSSRRPEAAAGGKAAFGPVPRPGWGFGGAGEDGLPAALSLFGRGRAAEPLLEILLTPEEARRGVSVPAEVPMTGPCPECGDSGLWARLACFTCGGSGRVRGGCRITLEIPGGVRHGSEFRCDLEPLLAQESGSFRVRVLVEGS